MALVRGIMARKIDSKMRAFRFGCMGKNTLPLYNWIDTFARLIIADKLLPKRRKKLDTLREIATADSYNGIFESVTSHYSNQTPL